MAFPEVEKNTIQKPTDDVFARQLQTKGGKGKRIWKGVGLSLLALCAGGAAFLTLTQVGRDTTSALTTYAPAIYEAKSNPDLIFDHIGPQVNILLIGRDVNWKIGKVYDPKTGKHRPFQVHDESAPARSDTMILVSLNKEDKTIRMVSFPRDAIVRLADNDAGVRRTKLNAAHAHGGPELLIKTMRDELGLTVHRHAVIKFDGFKNLIDQVGGIEVNVEGALKKGRDGKLYRGNLDYDDNWGNLHIHLKPGMQRLDGDTAHAYVRFRMDREGDPGRIRRQQQVMRALAKQMTQANLWDLPGLIQEVQKQFNTDMTPSELASAAAFAKNLGDTAKIQPLTLFGTYYQGGSICLNKPKNEKLLAYIFGKTFNPERFLDRSPSTTGDEIGPTRDNPDTKTILQAAGIIKSDDDMVVDPNADLPVRIEEPRTAESTERGSRYASASEENNDEEKPRRSRESSSRTRRTREKNKSETSRKSRAPRETSSKSSSASESAGSSGVESVIGGPTAREESGATRESVAEPPAEAPAPAPPTIETAP
ncbi:MAG TPA: LCP family protein [Abditibacteriaceae bacterium]